MMSDVVRTWGRGCAVVAAAAALLVLGGCRPRDPLDREVEARNLAELQSWLAGIRTEVDADLAREINDALEVLARGTPRYKSPANERDLHQPGNPLCRKIDGRPLREVMIDAYLLSNETLSQSNALDAENLIRLSSALDPSRAEAFARRVEVVKELMAARDEQIRHNKARIEQLRKPAG